MVRRVDNGFDLNKPGAASPRLDHKPPKFDKMVDVVERKNLNFFLKSSNHKLDPYTDENTLYWYIILGAIGTKGLLNRLDWEVTRTAFHLSCPVV